MDQVGGAAVAMCNAGNTLPQQCVIGSDWFFSLVMMIMMMNVN